jgi:hypothetical protein
MTIDERFAQVRTVSCVEDPYHNVTATKAINLTVTLDVTSHVLLGPQPQIRLLRYRLSIHVIGFLRPPESIILKGVSEVRVLSRRRCCQGRPFTTSVPT